MNTQTFKTLLVFLFVFSRGGFLPTALTECWYICDCLHSEMPPIIILIADKHWLIKQNLFNAANNKKITSWRQQYCWFELVGTGFGLFLVSDAVCFCQFLVSGCVLNNRIFSSCWVFFFLSWSPSWLCVWLLLPVGVSCLRHSSCQLLGELLQAVVFCH